MNILKARREAVRIVFAEIKKSDVVNGGVLEPDG